MNANQNDVITIWDATYIYIEKSSSYKFQKQTFSEQKKRCLLKFINICSTDGTLIETIGPYLSNGKNNDAKITMDIFKKFDDAGNWFLPEDFIIVDRGFRDALEFLKRHNYEPKMPSYLKGKSQHTAKEANNSRVITKIRWVIEAANGRIKRWKYLGNRVPNRDIKTIEKDYKFVCALINKYRPQLASTNDSEKFDLYKQMIEKANEENTLMHEVLNYPKRLSKNRVVNINELGFPKLTEEYIKSLTFGIYQMNQCIPYTITHLNQEADYVCELFDEFQEIIRVRIKSRFSSQAVHNTWIKFSSISSMDPIQGWYCDCKAGTRVFGACGHVTIVVWYLGYGIYNRENLLSKKSENFHNFCLDCDREDLDINDSSLIENESISDNE